VALAATSHDWLWQSTSDLRTVSASPGSVELPGYPPEDLIGRCVLDFIHSDDAVKAQLLLSDAVQSRKGWIDVELRWQHAAGHAVNLQGSASPIIDSSGRVCFRGTWRATRDHTSALRRMEIVAHRTRNLIAARAISAALQPIVPRSNSTGHWARPSTTTVSGARW
jgi:PAS domain S-box-containing protein